MGSSANKNLFQQQQRFAITHSTTFGSSMFPFLSLFSIFILAKKGVKKIKTKTKWGDAKKS